jgi:ribosomal protein L29
MGIEEGEEIQTKSTESIYNRIIAENLSNLGKRKGQRSTEDFENTKQARSEKKDPPRYIIVKT